MGTRLFPRTSNPAVLEILACVPKGTSQNRTFTVQSPAEVTPQLIQQLAVAQLENRRNDMSLPADVRNRWKGVTLRHAYNEVRTDMRRDFEYFKYLVDTYLNPEWKKLDGFEMFGWGRLAAPRSYLDDQDLKESYGGTTDFKQMAEILDWQLWDISQADPIHYQLDRRSWLMDRNNIKLKTPSGSVYLSELEGLAWG